jgi:hypothetical protein
MAKKTQSLELVKEDITRKAVQQVAAAQAEVEKEEALLYLGGIGAISNLADKLSSQSIRALEAFEQSKGYKALGYETFKDFLTESRYSPVSKNQYYDRLNALSHEGDATYDLLNALNVPISKRKKLPPGTVKVEGETVIVGESRFQLDDKRRVAQVITALSADNESKARKIEAGEKRHDKVKRERDELKKRGGSVGLDEYDTTLIQLLGLYANLTGLASEMTDSERLQKRDLTFARLADARLELEEALGVHAPSNGTGNYQLSEDDIAELGEEM